MASTRHTNNFKQLNEALKDLRAAIWWLGFEIRKIKQSQKINETDW